MIELRGTSHIAGDDLEDIRALIREKDPDVVALELDRNRLEALLNDTQQRRSPNLFFLVLKTVQDLLAKKTGVQPGSDMLAAFTTAKEEGKDVALIDRDIRETFGNLKDIPLLEKFKFAGFITVGSLLIPTARFDLNDVPDQELIQRLLLQFRVSFPSMYDVLVEERNRIMANNLQHLDTEYDHVLAFVGAGHVDGMRKLLENEDEPAEYMER